MLEKDGYRVSKTTNGEWKVVTPGGDTIPFKRDKGLTVGIPYIDLLEHQQGLALIKTVCKNMAGFTPQEIEKASCPERRRDESAIRLIGFSNR